VADEEGLLAVVLDRYPVTTGHTLIVPHRPVRRFQAFSAAEMTRLIFWVNWAQQHLRPTLSRAPDGFNLGVNEGEAAGQTIPQFHFQVIPRQADDVSDPRGGVRWVIPGKARYW